MGNTFGHTFRITTFGESHGGGVGVVIDGCPARLPIHIDQIQFELDRRRPGQSKLVTQRKESDTVEILSGIQDGITLGTGGRASARETIGRVAAGAVAKQLLKQCFGVEVLAWVERVQNLEAIVNSDTVTLEQIEENPLRCPDPQMAETMIAHIEEIRKAGNSVGGVIAAVAKNVPAGWGEPVFDKLEAELAKAIISLPACKGFEIGSGFAGTLLTGQQHNDEFFANTEGKVQTKTNRSGGIQGGISNGMPILIKAAFKPTGTIMHEQNTVNSEGENTTIKGRGRHDACVLPRAVPMVEAMIALVLADHALRQNTQTLIIS
ncbi:MAG: chorismate synthase [Armatimonadetes bacterium]|nr:chorismate synthase [Armatimonadota bacterium]